MMNEIEELKAENARLKEEFEIESLTDKTTKETIYRSNLVNKYKSCLQGIKAIVCGNYEIIDPQGRKDILKLITKAESVDNQ